MIKTVLLTGATGFIGSHLLEKLLNNDYSVIILKRSFSNVWRIENLMDQIKSYDIDQCDLKQPFEENSIDVVFNLATEYDRANKKQSQLLTTNLLFPIRLAELCRDFNVLYFFNTDSYFNNNKQRKNSLNLYSYSKHILREILFEDFSMHFKTFNFRLHHVFGEKDNQDKLIPYLIRTMKANQKIEITKGEQQLDFIFIKDAVSAFLHVLNNINKFTQNPYEFEIGSGKSVSLKEFIAIIKENLHSKSKIFYGAKEYRRNEIMSAEADLNPLKGWKPRHNIESIDYSKI